MEGNGKALIVSVWNVVWEPEKLVWWLWRWSAMILSTHSIQCSKKRDRRDNTFLRCALSL